MKLIFLKCFVFLSVFCFVFPLYSFSPPDLKKIIHKYSHNKGIRMSFKKMTYLKLLKKSKKSGGEILMSKGAFVLKTSDSLNTRIIFDRNHLWYIISPPGAKEEIKQIKLSAKERKSHLLSFLFSSDLFFQTFRFVSSRLKGRTWVLVFEPIKKSSDIESVSLKVEEDLILQVWLEWKNLKNKEEYTFSNIRFNQNIPPERFRIVNNKELP